MISVVSDLLRDENSYAVIATHSPQIIQEIPSSLIYYFDNDRMNPPVTPLWQEAFGENLSTLTEQIFHLDDKDENYKKIIRELFQHYSKEQILGFFATEELPLSMNAKLYIEYQALKNEKS